MSQHILAIDIETFSSVDLISCGVYRYIEPDDFEVLLFAYAYDDEPVKLVDLAAGEKIPFNVYEDLWDPDVLKTAFNANFERTCLAKHFSEAMPADQWECTMVRALSAGLPGSLEKVGEALGLAQQKDKIGKSLIRYFSIPCAPTRSNNNRTRNRYHHDPEKWQLFRDYCKQDVEVERAVRNATPDLPDSERALWALDQAINDRGVRIDLELTEQAIICDNMVRERLLVEAVKLTGLDNPNSVQQLTGWLSEAEGVEIESLTKDTVPALIKAAGSETTRRVLEIRQDLAKTSVKKYKTLLEATCLDGRIRGLLQFYGARTGRWAGRLFQPQNLARISLAERCLDLARRLVRSGRFDDAELFFGGLPFALSQLIRTAIIAEEGHELIVCDLSAIEARVLAWAAGETWALEEFRGAGKIYEATAARMYGVPKEQVTKSDPRRQKGKAATLGCGYGGGVNALKKMGAERDGLTEDEMAAIVKIWRRANPNIVRFWGKMEQAAFDALQGQIRVPVANGIYFEAKGSTLCMGLPSGRRLAYQSARIDEDPKTCREGLSYMGVDSNTKKWTRLRTYGGKLVENCIQAIARDIIADGMIAATEAGYSVVLTVHDELVCEVPIGYGSAKDLAALMTRPPTWAPDLPLAADGGESQYYCK